MVIELAYRDLQRKLDEAIHAARLDDLVLPKVWADRVRRLAELRYHKGYMAAMGGALLAKATDDRVDSLTHKRNQGPRAYQLRKPAEVLAKNRVGRYDIGSKSVNPLNTATFINNTSRIDAFVNVKPAARPSYEHFRDCMIELNGLSSGEATLALAAYIRVRMAVVRDTTERAAALRSLHSGALRLDDLLEIVELFVREAPEGGRRGEAFVAALFDCVSSSVDLPDINSPHPGDVLVMSSKGVALAIEVKQHSVNESTGLNLAREASEMNANSGLLVVISDEHAPLDRERIRHEASRDHGICISIAESTRELFHQVSVFAGGATTRITQEFPAHFLERMINHGVSEAGLERWQQLVAARTA